MEPGAGRTGANPVGREDYGGHQGTNNDNHFELFDKAKKDAGEGLTATTYDDLYPLVALAMIDGFMSSRELHHIIAFGERLGMNRAPVNATIERVQNGEMGEPSLSRAA